jgi:intracellular multiplication protein IcmE
MKLGGYTAKNLRDIGISLDILFGNTLFFVSLGYSVENIRDAEFLAEELYDLLVEPPSKATQLKDGKYTAKELKDSGKFSLSDLLDANYPLNELREAGYGPRELYELNVSLNDLKEIGKYTASEFKEDNFGAADLKSINFTAKELKDASFVASDLYTVYSAAELKEGTFSAGELKPYFTLEVLKNDAKYSATELKDALYTLAELVNVSFSVIELREAQYSAVELDEFFTLQELKAGGVSVREMIEGLNQEGTNEPVTFQYAKDVLNYTSADFEASGYNAVDLLLETNFSTTELLAAGFDIEPTPSTSGGGDGGAE